MTTESWPSLPEEPSRTLLVAAAVALLVEFSILTLVGWHEHWLAHPQKTGLDTTKFVEAQFYELPKEAPHLTEEKKVAVPSPQEPVLSKVPNQGKKTPNKNETEERNQTESGPKLAPTHGPVAVFSPSPEIPQYLRSQDIKTSAVIDFYISAQGAVTPRLVGSSGNEELDAIAIKTAKRWQFRPAEQEHKPVDSKVRLRILFEVH